MKIKNNLKKWITYACLFLFLACSMAYAAEATTEVGKFGTWIKGIVSFLEQIKTFIQIVATVVGMWFVYSALQLFRKHHTTQGAQGEHVKHGAGHLMLGVFLMCLVPAIQMLQGTISNNMGKSGSVNTFVVKDASIFDE